MPAPGGLALLIGKRLDKKGAGGDAGPPMSDDADPVDGDGDGEKDQMELSAISDFMSAKDPQTAMQALKDFLETCYPQLAGGYEEKEPGPEEV